MLIMIFFGKPGAVPVDQLLLILVLLTCNHSNTKGGRGNHVPDVVFVLRKRVSHHLGLIILFSPSLPNNNNSK